jgi:hypothetical protein
MRKNLYFYQAEINYEKNEADKHRVDANYCSKSKAKAARRRKRKEEEIIEKVLKDLNFVQPTQQNQKRNKIAQQETIRIPMEKEQKSKDEKSKLPSASSYRIYLKKLIQKYKENPRRKN